MADTRVTTDRAADLQEMVDLALALPERQLVSLLTEAAVVMGKEAWLNVSEAEQA